jgi:single-stranded DNA-binding protein
MDLNLVVIAGRLAADPEVKRFDGGSQLMRLLVTTKTDEPRRRIDVVPVTWWDVTEEQIEALDLRQGERVWVAGTIQRRFWSSDEGRRSRIEVVARDVQKGVNERGLGVDDLVSMAPADTLEEV